ncbi:MAG: four helix bundle protein [Bacteroidetes bacterium]|nr:MAG: four helix bundle protein [Bacteroidota bacterium]
MKKDNVIKAKSYAFSLRIVKLYKFLCEEKKEYTLSKQILRSGTGIGALVRESEHAESNADFIHKLSISLKEANETDYWLNILKDTGYIELKLFQSLLKDNNELLKLLTSIIKTCKTK